MLVVDAGRSTEINKLRTNESKTPSATGAETSRTVQQIRQRLTHAAEDADIITKEQLAARLSLPSTRMVDEMMRTRKIPFFRWGHRTLRFSWRRCQEALAKFEIKAVGQ